MSDTNTDPNSPQMAGCQQEPCSLSSTPDTDAVKVNQGRGIWIVNAEYMAEMERQRDILKAAGYVLKEAVEKLLDSDEQLKTTTDEDLEQAMENGYAAEIRTQAETILLARKAIGMTNYLFPENVPAMASADKSPPNDEK